MSKLVLMLDIDDTLFHATEHHKIQLNSFAINEFANWQHTLKDTIKCVCVSTYDSSMLINNLRNTPANGLKDAPLRIAAINALKAVGIDASLVITHSPHQDFGHTYSFGQRMLSLEAGIVNADFSAAEYGALVDAFTAFSQQVNPLKIKWNYTIIDDKENKNDELMPQHLYCKIDGDSFNYTLITSGNEKIEASIQAAELGFPAGFKDCCVADINPQLIQKITIERGNTQKGSAEEIQVIANTVVDFSAFKKHNLLNHLYAQFKEIAVVETTAGERHAISIEHHGLSFRVDKFSAIEISQKKSLVMHVIATEAAFSPQRLSAVMIDDKSTIINATNTLAGIIKESPLAESLHLEGLLISKNTQVDREGKLLLESVSYTEFLQQLYINLNRALDFIDKGNQLSKFALALSECERVYAENKGAFSYKQIIPFNKLITHLNQNNERKLLPVSTSEYNALNGAWTPVVMDEMDKLAAHFCENLLQFQACLATYDEKAVAVTLRIIDEVVASIRGEISIITWMKKEVTKAVPAQQARVYERFIAMRNQVPEIVNCFLNDEPKFLALIENSGILKLANYLEKQLYNQDTHAYKLRQWKNADSLELKHVGEVLLSHLVRSAPLDEQTQSALLSPKKYNVIKYYEEAIECASLQQNANHSCSGSI